MNRILTLVIVLLVMGIALSRTNDILIALSPYQVAEAAVPTAPVSADAPVDEAELAGRLTM
jgi:hypothetical protein